VINLRKEEIPDEIKKNILDLHYSRYLQYLNTSIIIIFTYFIGLIIASFTLQVDYTNLKQLGLIIIITIIFLSVITSLILKFKRHLKVIIMEVKKLRQNENSQRNKQGRHQ